MIQEKSNFILENLYSQITQLFRQIQTKQNKSLVMSPGLL